MIKCEKLAAGYGKETVIRDISWEAAEGRLTVIAGPNGSGKSTLVKSLAGQTVMEGGDVYLDGKPLRQWKSRDMAKRLAYLPQSRNDANISVFRMALHGRFPYLSYPRRYTREDEEMTIRALERMKINGLADKPVSELSGGEKQRVYLAMALVQDAPILLLDEPTTFLDISAQMELMEMLASLTKEGKTVVVVLHDLNLALQYAEEILLMENGIMRQCKMPEELLKSGALEEVFKVQIRTIIDEYGKAYYHFSKRGGCFFS